MTNVEQTFTDQAEQETAGAPSASGARKAIAFALACLIVATLAFGVSRRLGAGSGQSEAPSAFASAVDLTPLGAVATHYQGRLKSFESFAYSMTRQITGPGEFAGQSPGFTYLDLMLRPERYAGADVVFVKSKPLRAAIAASLEGSRWNASQIEGFMRSGKIAPPLILETPAVRERLATLSRDAIKAKAVEQVEAAMHLMHTDVLVDRLRIVPPPRGDFSTPWLSVGALTADGSGGAPSHDGHAHADAPATPGAGALAGMDEAASAAMIKAWADFVSGWRAEDAPKVNAAALALAQALPQANAALYPPREKLAWEARYFALGNMTWVWLVYLFASVFLLMGVVYRWRWAGVSGALVFALALGLHTFALGLRWYASGRWPNSNMFEAVTTAAWFGGVAALVLEACARKSVLRGMFFLCSAAASSVAFMAVHFLPLQLSPEVGNMMPVLHDVWLYIHTNVIIFSYCLIAMAAVTSALYLLHRLGGGAAEYARVGGAGLLLAARGAPDAGNSGGAAVGGGGSPGASRARRASVSFGEALDGATMTLMELSFIMLFTGTIMGAIWADHSWGRPWGWDPKEVFALATFLVYAVLIHVRFVVRDKGLWTAVLAVIGAAVMIFNWTVINFVITGLHSYA